MNNEKEKNKKTEIIWGVSNAEVKMLEKECPIIRRNPQPNYHGEVPQLLRVDEIIVHCTATPQGRNDSFADVRRMHILRQWKDIGYHFVILRDGTIWEGRPVPFEGSHCKGHNWRSLGVSYVGGLDSTLSHSMDTRTARQCDALTRLLRLLHARYPWATLHGHREFSAKPCPGFNVHQDYGGIFGERKC